MDDSTIVSSPIFGQIVAGPPGSGKTTYCKNIAEILRKLGRQVILVNIDPANDVSLPYDADIDISSLLKVNEVMESLNLGPNGGLLYSMEYLEQNIDWLIDQFKTQTDKVINQPLKEETRIGRVPYFIIDCPGQIELFTHHESFKTIINNLTNRSKAGFDLRLCAVYLVDSHYANDPAKFISALLNSLSAMLHLELPHVNLLTKVDLMSRYGPTRFGLSYFCDVLDLNYLVDDLNEDPFLAQYKDMTKKLADVIESYSLVSFLPLNIKDNRTIIRCLRTIDKAIGFHLIDLDTEDEMERIYKNYQPSEDNA